MFLKIACVCPLLRCLLPVRLISKFISAKGIQYKPYKIHTRGRVTVGELLW